MSAIDQLTLTPIPPEAEALRAEVRAFLTEATAQMPAHIRAKSWSGFDPEFSKKLGAKGWLGMTFPKAYGGGGKTAFERYVLVEEFLNFGAPVGSHWIAERQSGPLILKYGTEAQKQDILPRIARGELYCCIGMSEPNSGSDLASVKTRAEKNDQGWLLNGQKIWTTNAHHCQYMIALVRTSGVTEDRQKGLSQVLVDLSLPGITVRPIEDLAGDSHFCEVFFDNVQLPAEALVGNEGQGWEQVNAELAFERSGPERLFSSIVLFDQWLAFIRTPQGKRPESTRLAGQIVTRIAPLRAMSIAIQDKLARHESPIVEAALVKDQGTVLEQYIPAAIADDLLSREDEADIPFELMQTLSYVTHVAPCYTLRGGTRSILRGMIARGLGLR